MDKDIVVLLIGILIIGLAGGFILSFVVYQPQIQSLRNDLASLEDEIDSRFAANEKYLSDLNKTISNLNATIANLNSTSETPENETETYAQLVVQAQATSNGTHFEVNFSIVNSGTAPDTLTSIYLYQYPIQNVPDIVSLVLNGTTYSNKTFTLPISAGESVGGTMTLIEGSDEGFNFQSGMVLEFRFISAHSYPDSVIVSLP